MQIYDNFLQIMQINANYADLCKFMTILCKLCEFMQIYVNYADLCKFMTNEPASIGYDVTVVHGTLKPHLGRYRTPEIGPSLI